MSQGLRFQILVFNVGGRSCYLSPLLFQLAICCVVSGCWSVHGPIRKGQRQRREDNNSFHFIQTNKLFRNEIESDLQRQRRRITASFIPCRRILKCDLKTNKILEIKLFQFTKESDLQRQIQAWQRRLSSLGRFKNTF